MDLNGVSITEAINRLYRSKLYKKLSTESTKYWHLGPVDLYEELKQELQKRARLLYFHARTQNIE